MRIDYSKAKAIAAPYTVSEDGLMIAYFNAGNNAQHGVYISGVQVLKDDGDGSGQCGTSPVSSGDTITVNCVNSQYWIKIAPYKS